MYNIFEEIYISNECIFSINQSINVYNVKIYMLKSIYENECIIFTNIKIYKWIKWILSIWIFLYMKIMCNIVF